MNDKAYKEKTFIIHLDEIKYCIELLNKNPHHTRFKVSTECEYMFTLCADENGNCGIEDDFLLYIQTW